jgi:hypothetical protein
MRVSVGDVELEVDHSGEGRPVVALHGGRASTALCGSRRSIRSSRTDEMIPEQPEAFLGALRAFLARV